MLDVQNAIDFFAKKRSAILALYVIHVALCGVIGG